MANLPEGRVGHLSTGRLRVRIPDRRGDDPFFKTVEERLAGWDSVHLVEVNPLTASVLVHFSDFAALFAENIAKNDLFAVDFDELIAASQPGQSLTQWAAQRVGEADRAMRRWTSGAADIRNTMFLLLIVGAAIQLLRGNIAVPATTLAWYAGEMLRLWEVLPPAKEAVSSEG